MLPCFNMIGVPVTQNFQMVNIQRIETALVYFFLHSQSFILEWLFCGLDLYNIVKSTGFFEWYVLIYFICFHVTMKSLHLERICMYIYMCTHIHLQISECDLWVIIYSRIYQKFLEGQLWFMHCARVCAPKLHRK